MIVILHTIRSAFQTVFSHKRYLLVSTLAAACMLGILIFVPVGRISFSVLYYQITSLDAFSLLIMVSFSIVWGTLLALNIYRFKKTHPSKPHALGHGFLSMFSSLMAGIFGSAVCVACLSLLFGFLGLPTIAFLLAYRTEFFVLSAVVAFLLLYLSSKAIVAHGACKICTL